MAEAAARNDQAAFWGPPVYSDVPGTILNLRRPVRRGDFVGMVVAALKITELSQFIASLESESASEKSS